MFLSLGNLCPPLDLKCYPQICTATASELPDLRRAAARDKAGWKVWQVVTNVIAET